MAGPRKAKVPAPVVKKASAPAVSATVQVIASAPIPNRYRVKAGAPPVWTGRELATQGQEVTLLPGEIPSMWLEPIE